MYFCMFLQISNIELSGENLFIGTDEGLIIQFKLKDRKSTSEASANIGRIKELGPVNHGIHNHLPLKSKS